MNRPLLAALAAVAALLAVPGGSASASTSPPSPATSTATSTATRTVTVRPVTTDGTPAPGWTVKRLTGSVDCDGSAVAATDDGITECYPTAYGLRACWKSSNHTVLCLRDATTERLFRVRYSGRYPHAKAPKVATPINLTLAGGRACVVRYGGAWGAPSSHPNWVGFYSCNGGASVYGPGRGDGVNRHTTPWNVRLWFTDDDRIVRRKVGTAYYVGTAAA